MQRHPLQFTPSVHVRLLHSHAHEIKTGQHYAYIFETRFVPYSEVRQSRDLEMGGHRRLNVTNDVVLLVVLAMAEGEVERELGAMGDDKASVE